MRLLTLASFIAIAGACSSLAPNSLARPDGTAAPSSIQIGSATITVGAGPTPGVGCSATEVASRLNAFLDAFNRGDQAALPSFFDRSLTFTEGNPAPTGFFTSSGPQQLLDYFGQRHTRHEVRELKALTIIYQSGGDPDRVDFGYQIQRSADEGTRMVSGKGVMSCTKATISLWNMG